MSENPDNQIDQKIETIALEEINREWNAIATACPSLSLLPSKTASLYGASIPGQDALTLEEIQNSVFTRVVQGLVLFYRVLFEKNLLTLHGQFDVILGSAIETVMSDLYDSDENYDEIGNVKRCDAADVCGMLVAFIAIDVHSNQHDKEDVVSEREIDPITGFFKDLESIRVMPLVQSVLNCLSLNEEYKLEIRRRSERHVHLKLFTLLDPDKNSTWH